MNISTTPPSVLLTQKPQQVPQTQKIAHKAYNKLRNDLVTICQKIEDSLTAIYANQGDKLKGNSYEKEQEEKLAKEAQRDELAKAIRVYKKKTKDIETQLGVIYRMSKIEEIESDIHEKERKMTKIKNENDTLNSIREKQVKGLEEYQKKVQKRNEIVVLTEKIAKLKEEYRSKKRYYKTTDEQTKSLVSKINLVEKKCRVIKDNMNYKKQQQNIGIEKGKKPINNEELEELKKKAEFNQQNFLVTEKQYKALIEEQNERIEQLNDEIKILTIKIQDIEQEKRIKELKEKETKRKNELITQQNQFFNNLRRKKISFNRGYHEVRDVSQSNPQPFSTRKKGFNQPFEIQRMLNEKNSASNPFNKDLTYFQIEQLKTDIQSAIDKNDQNLLKELKKTKPSSKSQVLYENEEEVVNDIESVSNEK